MCTSPRCRTCYLIASLLNACNQPAKRYFQHVLSMVMELCRGAYHLISAVQLFEVDCSLFILFSSCDRNMIGMKLAAFRVTIGRPHFHMLC